MKLSKATTGVLGLGAVCIRVALAQAKVRSPPLKCGCLLNSDYRSGLGSRKTAEEAYAFNCPPKRGIVDNLDRPCTTPARLWAWGPVLATRIEVSTPVTSILRAWSNYNSAFHGVYRLERTQVLFSAVLLPPILSCRRAAPDEVGYLPVCWLGAARTTTAAAPPGALLRHSYAPRIPSQPVRPSVHLLDRG
eukprot:1185869-Prorocentrum_minimum.AAC.2